MPKDISLLTSGNPPKIPLGSGKLAETKNKTYQNTTTSKIHGQQQRLPIGPQLSLTVPIPGKHDQLLVRDGQSSPDEMEPRRDDGEQPEEADLDDQADEHDVFAFCLFGLKIRV